ncbi:MAG: hypothetical protein H7338_03460, partial [Candidatus Sericytochromatia bacterium]|nr:hypothetical protein [Candidatus Sericytochromatia bacterium]
MPGTITAALPANRPSLRLTDAQLGTVVTALDTNHDGRLSGDEMRPSLSARGRLQDGTVTTAGVTSALRDEKVALRQLPTAVANQVAAMLIGQLNGMSGLPRSFDTDRNGTLSQAELASVLNKGQLIVNHSVRAATGGPQQEEHFAAGATLPVGDIVKAMEQSEYFIIRGDGASALSATVQGLTVVAAAGGETGLTANAIYQGINALSHLPQYASHPGWVALVGRFGMAAMLRGETNAKGILAAAARQIMYERPDEAGVRTFFEASLKAIQTQLPAEDDR